MVRVLVVEYVDSPTVYTVQRPFSIPLYVKYLLSGSETETSKITVEINLDVTEKEEKIEKEAVKVADEIINGFNTLSEIIDKLIAFANFIYPSENPRYNIIVHSDNDATEIIFQYYG